jgi:apolipoprotein N-acyltransferase
MQKETMAVPLVRRWRLPLLAFSGLLTGFCVVFPILGVLQWLSLVPCMLVLYDIGAQEAAGQRQRLRRIWTLGLLFYMCYYPVNFHWFLAMYPLEFTELSSGAAAFVVVFAWLGLSLLQALGAAFVFVGFVLCARTKLVRRYRFLEVPLIAALWIVLEWGQTFGWTGVPWGRLCLGQTWTPVMLGTASLFGSYVISLSILIFNAALAYALMHADRLRLCSAVCAFCLLFTAVGGVLVTWHQARVSAATEARVKVAAIQGNLGSADKWDMRTSEMFDHYFALTEEAAENGAELIVWPETAVPVTLLKYSSYKLRLAVLAQVHQATILVGAFTENSDGEKYNSIIAFNSDGSVSENVYSKRHLVPFGEYVPMRELIIALVPPLAELVQVNILAGDDAAVHQSEMGGIGSLICFDSIYETLALDSVRHGAQLLTVSTNDSWFFDSAAARMHNAQAQLRAVETGRWIVRAASTGISSIIAPDGTIVARQDALTEGILYGEVEMRSQNTLYSALGNVVAWVCVAYVFGLLATGLLTKKDRSHACETDPCMSGMPEADEVAQIIVADGDHQNVADDAMDDGQG